MSYLRLNAVFTVPPSILLERDVRLRRNETSIYNGIKSPFPTKRAVHRTINHQRAISVTAYMRVKDKTNTGGNRRTSMHIPLNGHDLTFDRQREKEEARDGATNDASRAGRAGVL